MEQRKPVISFHSDRSFIYPVNFIVSILKIALGSQKVAILEEDDSHLVQDERIAGGDGVSLLGKDN